MTAFIFQAYRSHLHRVFYLIADVHRSCTLCRWLRYFAVILAGQMVMAFMVVSSVRTMGLLILFDRIHSHEDHHRLATQLNIGLSRSGVLPSRV